MDNTESLARRIAQLLEAEGPSTSLSSVQKSLDEVIARLDKLETAISAPQVESRFSRKQHPSREKFTVAEALAAAVPAGARKEEACAFEPNGRPCDHCAMCSSRGF